MAWITDAAVASFRPRRQLRRPWTSFFAFVHRTLPPVFLTSCGHCQARPSFFLIPPLAPRAGETAFLASAGKVMVLLASCHPRPLQPASLGEKGRRRLVPNDTDKGFARSCLNRATQAAPATEASFAPAATSRAVALAFGARRSFATWISTTACAARRRSLRRRRRGAGRELQGRGCGQFTHAAAVSSRPSTGVAFLASAGLASCRLRGASVQILLFGRLLTRG